MKLERGPKIVLGLVLLAAAAVLAGNRQFYTEALASVFFALALGSTVVLHLRVRPRWTEMLLLLSCGAVLAILDFYILKFPFRGMALVSLLGLSSMLLMGLRCITSEGKERRLLLYAFFPAVLFVTSEWCASTLLNWTEAAHPKTLDLYLYSFDASMRVQLSFLAGQAFRLWPILREGGLLFYIGLPFATTVVYSGQLLRDRSKSLSPLVAFLITGPLGVLFYNLFPAMGPVHVFGQNFPAHPLTIDQVRRLLLEPIAVTGPRNAIPSLHMAWVLLAWWYSRGLSWMERSLAMAFVVFTVAATLGTGEHYFVDLVVAFPFALLIQAICSFSLSWNDARRLVAILFGGGVTLAWLAALHFVPSVFWTSWLVPWMLATATIVLSCIRQSRLEQAVLSGPALAPSAARDAHISAEEAASPAP